ncbi:MAG: hypothetical protein HGB11_07195 [Chlorobiales bacterium]|nr:hypothetical protein [Chlorobiales bacterium]
MSHPPLIPLYQEGGYVPTPSGDGLSPSLDKWRAGEGLSSDSGSAPVFNSAYLPYNKNLTTLARENRIWQKVLRIGSVLGDVGEFVNLLNLANNASGLPCQHLGWMWGLA